MSHRYTVLIGLAVGLLIYTPIGIYLFDNSIATILDRAYFTACGAIIALYANRIAA